MNWNKGYSSSFYATFIDTQSWRDLDKFEIISGNIQCSDSSLRVSADVDTLSYNQNQERWIRIWADIRQGGASEHIPLFTGIATSPTRDIDGNIFKNSLQCYSVLKPCEDILLQRGWYAPAGVSGAVIISQLLEATPAPVEIEENAPSLTQAIVAEDGESNLTMIEKILTAINWILVIDGRGNIKVCSKPTEISASFDSLENDSIEPQLSEEYDWFNAPNVFRAVKDDLVAVAKDDREDSFLSIQNRGREVWAEDTSPNLNDNESIADYAIRRLKEEQNILISVEYQRRFRPDLYVSDLVRLHYPKQKIDGKFKIISQSISLGYGMPTSEEVLKVE